MRTKKPWTMAEKRRVDREADAMDRLSVRLERRAMETADTQSPQLSDRYVDAKRAAQLAAYCLRQIQPAA